MVSTFSSLRLWHSVCCYGYGRGQGVSSWGSQWPNGQARTWQSGWRVLESGQNIITVRSFGERWEREAGTVGFRGSLTQYVPSLIPKLSHFLHYFIVHQLTLSSVLVTSPWSVMWHVLFKEHICTYTLYMYMYVYGVVSAWYSELWLRYNSFPPSIAHHRYDTALVGWQSSSNHRHQTRVSQADYSEGSWRTEAHRVQHTQKLSRVQGKGSPPRTWVWRLPCSVVLNLPSCMDSIVL